MFAYVRELCGSVLACCCLGISEIVCVVLGIWAHFSRQSTHAKQFSASLGDAKNTPRFHGHPQNVVPHFGVHGMPGNMPHGCVVLLGVARMPSISEMRCNVLGIWAELPREWHTCEMVQRMSSDSTTTNNAEDNEHTKKYGTHGQVLRLCFVFALLVVLCMCVCLCGLFVGGTFLQVCLPPEPKRVGKRIR